MEYTYPFKTAGEKKMELFNEVILILVFYTMMCFTQFVPEVETKEKIGYVSASLVALHFLVNLGVMLVHSCCNAKKTCRLNSARKKHEIERKTLQELLKKNHNQLTTKLARKAKTL